MVMVSEFRTTHLPVAERFNYWCGMTADTLLPCTLSTDRANDFRAGLRLLDLGVVQISALSYPSLETYRSAKQIRRSDPEGYQLMLNLRGGHRIIQGGQDTTSRAGELLLYDTSRPWHGWAGLDTGMVEGILVQLPRTLLPLPADRVRALTAARIPGREGIGALFAGYLKQMVASAGSYIATDGPRLATVTIDLLTALCAHHLDIEQVVQPETHRRALLLRIHAFVEQHLGDPHLAPSTIAAAFQISTRHLHRISREQGLTVSGWIRQRRLERCRRDLTDPALVHRPIHIIAARWGLTDAARFSRAFRAAYGIPPSEYRHMAHRSSGRSTSTTWRSSLTTC